MSAPVLVVTGSRALHALPAARAWAHSRIRDALAAQPWRYVAHGGARGPDMWADELACEQRIRRIRYALDGWVYNQGARTPHRWGSDEWRALAGPRLWPLCRNDALVDDHAAGGAAWVLALVAPWAKTSGALYTATRAMRAGLPTWVASCPRELGPAGAP